MNPTPAEPHAAIDTAAGERPTRVRWMVFGLGCGTSWFLYLHRYTFALIKPTLAKEWDLDEVQLGWLDFSFSFTYSVAQVPSGILGDVLGAHLFLSVIMFLWVAAFALHAFAPNYGALATVRVLFGLSQAGCYPTLSNVSKTWFPRSVRTSLQGWIASFFGRIGGFSTNMIFAPVLMDHYALSWQTSVLVFCVPGFAFAILFAWFYRNSAREHPRANESEARLIEAEDLALQGGGSLHERISFREMIAGMSLRSLANFFCLLVQQFSSTFADSIYALWVPFFLAKEHGLNFTEMGIYSSLPLLGGACGGAFGGFLNDWLIRTSGNRRWSRSAVGLIGKGLACGLIFYALTIYENPYAFCWVLFLVKFFSDWSQPTVWGTVTDIGGRASATVFGFNNMIGGFGGNVSPVIFGYVAKYYSWNVVFTLVGGAYLISSLSWLFVNCTIPVINEQPRSDEPTQK